MFVKTIDKRTYYGVRLSENVGRDSNGQLIAANVPIARTGMQEYMGGELNKELEQDKVYTVERLPEDVFDETFIASLENKPFVDLHPDEDIVVGKNHTQLTKGYMRDIKPGHLDIVGLEDKYYDENGNNVLFADLVITDKDMIDFVELELKKSFNNREIDLSLGYDAEYIQISDSGFKQIPIIGNHIARVPHGRAGVAKIRDNATIDLTHNNEYFKQSLPFIFEGGLKKQGITKLKFVIMTPEEYYDELVYKAQTHFRNEVIPTDDEQIKGIIAMLNTGDKMDIPYVVYDTNPNGSNNQDGRHRVEAMRRLGVQNVPVLILYKTKEAIKVNDADTTKSIMDQIYKKTAEIEEAEKKGDTKKTNALYKEYLKLEKKFHAASDEKETKKSKDEDKTKDAIMSSSKGAAGIKNDFAKLKIAVQNKSLTEKQAQREIEILKDIGPDKVGSLGSALSDMIGTLKKYVANTKDSKSYNIKFKDAIYEMHGFESKKEAKDYALIFHEIVNDAIKPDRILNEAHRKIDWSVLGTGAGMKAKQKLSDNWKHWIKEIENGNWDVARTIKELKRTFSVKDAKSEYVVRNKNGMYYFISGGTNVIFTPKRKADTFPSKAEATSVANRLKNKEHFKKYAPYTIEAVDDKAK